MERINIQCVVSGQDTRLQLDRKSMPGEAGSCFMLTAEGCFKGYISQQKDGSFTFLGMAYYTSEDLQIIVEQLNRKVNDA